MTRQWEVQLRGHNALVSIMPNNAGGFTGSIRSTEYGEVPISDGFTDGTAFTGDVTLNGTHAKLKATVNPNGTLSGTASVGWFFHADFSGTPVA